MLTLTNILNTATTQQYGLQLKERLGKCYNANNVTPAVTVAYSVGNSNLVDGVLFATVYVTVNAVYPPVGSGTVAASRSYIETFNVAFSGATADSVINFASTAVEINPAYESCSGRAKGFTADTSVTLTLA